MAVAEMFPVSGSGLSAVRAAAKPGASIRWEMFAKAGEHALTFDATNLGGELGNLLKSTGCVAYNTDLRIKVEATGLFTYPMFRLSAREQRFG